MAPEGYITRGTTGVNRLRRVDRWVHWHPLIHRALADAAAPLAVDLGYGARPTTTLEWAGWLRRTRPDVSVVGLEIDPARVVPQTDGVRFALGGFELAGLQPTVLRAMNVLRQYSEPEVMGAWQTMLSGLAPGGFLIEGTCDEIGRRCCWILLNSDGPVSLTLAWDPLRTVYPSELAARLPKALIHRNVPGERIHYLLTLADQCVDRAAGFAPFGPRVRWREALTLLHSATNGDVFLPRRRLQDNQLTIKWSAISPTG